jgi:transketolase
MSAQTSFLKELAEDVRRSAFSTIYNAGSGHLGACSSSSELMTALYFGGVMNYDPENPRAQDRDRVYVRGHVGPLRYKYIFIAWLD